MNRNLTCLFFLSRFHGFLYFILRMICIGIFFIANSLPWNICRCRIDKITCEYNNYSQNYQSLKRRHLSFRHGPSAPVDWKQVNQPIERRYVLLFTAVIFSPLIQTTMLKSKSFQIIQNKR